MVVLDTEHNNDNMNLVFVLFVDDFCKHCWPYYSGQFWWYSTNHLDILVACYATYFLPSLLKNQEVCILLRNEPNAYPIELQLNIDEW